MAKMSCFPALLAGGRRKKHRKVADATKVGCSECPKVKPVEFIIDAPVAATVPVKAKKGVDQQVDDKVTVKGDDKVPVKSVGSDDCGGAAPEQDTAASPRLKRSCSNIETKRPGPRDDAAAVPVRSRSYSDLPAAAAPSAAAAASPASVKTSRSADRVMLRKRSSSQVLPSRSRKLWWRLFLWSHRNLHRPRWPTSPAGRHGGYTSDTHDVDRKIKKVVVDGSPPPVPSQQWVAFCADDDCHVDRVSAWVSSIDIPEDIEDASCAYSNNIEPGEPSSSGKGKSKRVAADEVVQANNVVQSLNAFSSVAHISGMGLKVVPPMLAPFSTLRAVNLSGNFIVHISPGSLPKGLHSLDLSRNKIAAMEGLRELTKLRVLSLSYNRISRIGHGLSNCTAIRELYLTGNRISDVEGLHRLLKLAVLDLSFNKITTAKALGQLVANYHSLLALNLLGNPVQANIGDEALRRTVTGLLPSLAYLNKQPVKPQRAAREVATDSVARAALGGGRTQRRRASRRVGSGSGDGSGGRSRSKGRYHGSGSSSMRK